MFYIILEKPEYLSIFYLANLRKMVKRYLPEVSNDKIFNYSQKWRPRQFLGESV